MSDTNGQVQSDVGAIQQGRRQVDPSLPPPRMVPPPTLTPQGQPPTTQQPLPSWFPQPDPPTWADLNLPPGTPYLPQGINPVTGHEYSPARPSDWRYAQRPGQLPVRGTPPSWVTNPDAYATRGQPQPSVPGTRDQPFVRPPQPYIDPRMTIYPDPAGRNNPGNIRDPRTGGFATFQTPKAGTDAIRRTLLGYQDRRGLNTVAGIIST